MFIRRTTNLVKLNPRASFNAAQSCTTKQHLPATTAIQRCLTRISVNARPSSDSPIEAGTIPTYIDDVTPVRQKASAEETTPTFTSFAITSESDQMASRVRPESTASEIVTDEDRRAGGRNMGPHPLELFLASIAGSLNSTTMSVASEMNIPVQSIKLKAEGHLDTRGTRGVSGVSPHFNKISIQAIVTSPATQQQIDSLKEEVEDRCMVLSLVKKAYGDVELENRWIKV